MRIPGPVGLPQRSTAGNINRLVINPIIYGEVSGRFCAVEALDTALDETIFIGEKLPFAAPSSPARRFSITAAAVAAGNRCCRTS
jgi:hypothetical protein